MPVPHRTALAAALAASLLTACATPPVPPTPQAAPAPAPSAADAVKVGQSRAEVEAALGVPTQVEEDADGVQAVYMTGMPDLSAYRRATTAGTRRRHGARPARDRHRPSRNAVQLEERKGYAAGCLLRDWQRWPEPRPACPPASASATTSASA